MLQVRTDGQPDVARVGIFWWADGTLIQQSVPVGEGCDEYSHVYYPSKQNIDLLLSAAKSLGYLVGKVIYNCRARCFDIFVDPRLMPCIEFKRACIEQFQLADYYHDFIPSSEI